MDFRYIGDIATRLHTIRKENFFRRAWGGDLTFFKNWQSNSLPTGKSFQSNATKFPNFPTPGCTLRCQISQGWIQERYNKNISKQNSEIFIYITLPHHQRYMFPLRSVTAAIIRFNHNPCYAA